MMIFLRKSAIFFKVPFSPNFGTMKLSLPPREIRDFPLPGIVPLSHPVANPELCEKNPEPSGPFSVARAHV